MKRSNSKLHDSRSLAVISAFALTWLALPVSSVLAQSFPTYPLQTGAGNVEPNIMFILDDSGSMADSNMTNPDINAIEACLDSPQNGCDETLRITTRTYVGNTLYYNPATTYQPWLKSDGTRFSGGTTLASVFGSRNFAGAGYGEESDTINLTDSSSCQGYNSNGGTSDVCGGIQTFYVPKSLTNTTETYLENALNYYRYQIRPMNGVSRMIRSEIVAGGSYGDFPPIVSNETVTDQRIAEWDDEDFGRNDSENFPFTLDFAVTSVRVTLQGDDPNAQLFLQQRANGNNWTTVCQGANSTTNRTSNEDCTFANAPANSYRVRVTTPDGSNDAADNVDIDVYITYNRQVTTPQDSGCGLTNDDFGWGGCTYARPASTRTSESEEFTNYATWFSYHRTRMKIAKAGAAEAFHQLGDNVRVGYRSLHQNNTNSNYDIPVQDGNSGVFEGTARTSWFTKLFNALGTSGTPLRSTLAGTGEYFKSTAASGPYGPGTAANQLACRQSFSILTTDGYWNGDFGGIAVGDQDGTAGASILDPSDATTAIRYTAADPFRDGPSTSRQQTLADVAMKYWKEDLRTDMDNIVPTSTNNPAFWQHMVTFGISIGLKGTVDQTTVADVLTAGRPRVNGVNVAWPDPQMSNQDGGAEIAARIDDLLHASVNGRGEFVAATNAQDFSAALNGVLGQIQSRLASGSNVATNSTSYQSNSRIYQATYRSVQWTGELVSRPISNSGISATPEWSVVDKIADTYADGSAGNDYHARTVLTWTGTAGAAFPTTAQSLALVRDTGPATVTGTDNASYIKGNPALERANGGTLRNRITPLGDIINSSPFYVPDTNSLYVGANDGMLHGIDALTGVVLFSYVPAGLNFTRLRDLSDPAYGHAFFVDGQASVSSAAVTPGESLLVGSLGRGGKGVFGLDVSDPDSMANGDVLWDKTAANDADMGYVLGAPVIVKTNDGSAVALVPNGVESTNGDSVLFVIDLETGDEIAKISTGNTSANGLSTPRTADLDRDGDVDYVYAGDMLGNMWKFDLSDSDPGEWGVALGGLPLFVARSSTNGVQPITGAPALARETAEDRIWVTFGTGRFIYASDVSDTSIQTWYGVIDDGESVVRADLTERDIAAVGVDSQGRDVRAFEADADLPSGSMGWFIDLDEPLEGERIIGSARVNGTAAIVSSMAPTAASGCENEGAGFLNAVDLFTGTSPNSGSPGSPASFFDLDGDGTGTSDGDMLVDADGNELGAGSVNSGVGAHYDSRDMGGDYVVCGSNGECTVIPGGDQPPGGADTKRLSWREIFGED